MTMGDGVSKLLKIVWRNLHMTLTLPLYPSHAGDHFIQLIMCGFFLLVVTWFFWTGKKTNFGPDKFNHAQWPLQSFIDDCIERDTYYEGYDLYSERNTPKTPTAEKCQYICSITPDCKYFSFMKDAKICWLMKNLSKKSSHTGVADSGPKQCPLTPIGLLI